MGFDALELGFETVASLFDFIVTLLDGRFFPSDILLQLDRRIVNHPRLVRGRNGPVPLDKRFGFRFGQGDEQSIEVGSARPVSEVFRKQQVYRDCVVEENSWRWP